MDKVKLPLTEAKTGFNKNFQLKLLFDQNQRFDFFPCLLELRRLGYCFQDVFLSKLSNKIKIFISRRFSFDNRLQLGFEKYYIFPFNSMLINVKLAVKLT